MASLYIQTNQTKTGKTYAVKYRRGGMGWPIEHAGTFKTKREADIRKQKVGEWLAAGLNPRDELRALTTAPLTMADACDQWLESRRSIGELTRISYRAKVARIKDDLKMSPHALTVHDVNAWVSLLADEMKPGTVAGYVQTLRMILDHADVRPNPARDRRVELPRREHSEVVPPTADEFLSVLRKVNAKHRLPVVVLEQTGMRVNEVASMGWDDVDVAGSRLRVSAANSKTGRGRWVDVPEWVIGALGEQNGSLRVFPGRSRQSVYRALERACNAAGVRRFGPHALRHRRASILHYSDTPDVLAAAYLGHSLKEFQDTYTHVMRVDEVSHQDLLSALA